MNSLVLIPARSGSNRVFNKNIRSLGDKPLMAHGILSAKDSGASRVIVSTNDEDMANTARSFGAETPFLRPDELSHASASSLSCILHALKWLRDNESWTPDMLAFCPPTTPFVKAGTTAAMFDALDQRSDATSITTICEIEIHPFLAVRKKDNGRLATGIIKLDGKTIHDVERSQDFPLVYKGSPACRITRSNFFMPMIREGEDSLLMDVGYIDTYDIGNCIWHEIDRIEAFDINDETDWSIAEGIHARRKSG